jgi:lysine-arginine-ornithine-binding protein
MKTIVAITLATAATFGSAASAQDSKIKIATEGVYPPFNYMEGGKLTGFDVDIANALCAKAKLDCEIVTQDWDGMIPGLLAGKYNAIVASMAITDERKQKVNFSAPYYNTPAKFMASKEAAIKDVSPAALAGKIVGVQGSTSQSKLLEEKYPGVEVKTYTAVDDASADLAAGRVDVVFSDKVLLDAWLKKSSEGACCELVGEDVRDPALGAGKGVAVGKENPELLAKFDQALKEILSDGTYKAINDKYFTFSIY